MTSTTAITTADTADAHVDAEIAACLNLGAPKSFFLFAGAGSGKTRSLVTALQHVQKNLREQLRVKGQRVGVITFTNAASDEIKRRLLFDPLIDVRTIHSFAWSLIDGLNHDIREWLRVDLAKDIVQLKEDEAKGRKGTKASATRLSKIESKSKRFQNLPNVKSFAKTFSPLLTQAALREAKDTKEHLQQVNAAIDMLMALWKDGADPTLLQILRCVAENNLFEIPEALQANASGAIEQAEAGASEKDEQEDRQTERAVAIQTFLSAPFSQIEPMAEYLSGEAHFDTHQGVKGLEFDRVMVIMDDKEAKGFLFKYEDLFGGKAAGDKTVESTKRLFYVTASRAKESLALVAYSSSPERVQHFVLKEGWFGADEIVFGVPA